MTKLFLLDAYALIYRAYYAFIKNPRINSKKQNTSAIFGFVNTLEDVIKKEEPTHIGIAFDPSGPTFRHELYPEYKAQREETPEAIKYSVPIIKDIIKAYNIPILEVNGFEADDVIGTLATKAGKMGIKTYMMTPDKDYAQLVNENVMMYRPKYGDKEFEILGPEEVKEKYHIENTKQVIDLLGLMGDSADNIPGCPGVGEKTAQKLINEYGSVENILLHTPEMKGALKTKLETNKELIEFSKMLATIKTDVPIELNLEELKTEEKDKEKLSKIFEELEFHSFLDKLNGKTNKIKKEEKNNRNMQGDLFAPAIEKKDQREPNLFDLFSVDIKKGTEFSNYDRLESLTYSYRIADNKELRTELIQYLYTHEEFCFDTETTGLNTIGAKLVGMSFCVKENEAFYVPVPKELIEAQKIIEEFKDLFGDEKIRKIGQNMKYDISVLANYGVEVKGKLFDTMIAHYVLYPNLRHGMDYLAEIYLNYKTIHIEELIGAKGKNQRNMSDLLSEQIYKYACEDADVTYKLKTLLEKELIENNSLKLFEEIEMPLVPVLAYMERNGATIDVNALEQASNLFSQRMNDIEKQIHALAGENFNISSPKQVGEILFDKLKIVEKAKKTKTGQYVTSEDVLESLKGKHEIVDKILEYRGLKKLLSTYIDALPQLINPETGKIHTSYNQAVTATGRLSSSNPNLQNIPIRNEDGKEIRKAFIPEEGCEFYSADYSQIELRIMAHLSNDTHMIEAFQSGQDIHAATAAKVYKTTIENVSKEQRSKAKTANFGIIYGISVFGLAERMNVPRAEAKMLIDEYFETYPKIKQYMDKSIQKARENGYSETIFGRKCYLPDINSHNAVVRGYAERNAINAPIQGSAADIIKVAMINIYNRFRKENIRSKMILQVHDELNFSVYPGEKEKVERIVKQEMENAVKLQIPLVADSGWGKNWLEAH